MKRERWLFVTAVLIFAGLAVYYLRPGWVGLAAKKKAPAPVTQSTGPQLALQPIAEPSLPAVGEVVDEQTPWGRNPFLSEEELGKGKVQGTNGLQVKTIIVGWPKSVAIIDGHTVGIGEKVGEETVREIGRDYVVLEREGHKRMLKVSQPSVAIEVKGVKK